MQRKLMITAIEDCGDESRVEFSVDPEKDLGIVQVFLPKEEIVKLGWVAGMRVACLIKPMIDRREAEP